MKQYINYSSMSPFERHVFQSTGECDKQFHMSEDAFNQMVDEIVNKQAVQQELIEEQV